MSWAPPSTALPETLSSPKGSVSVRCRGRHERLESGAELSFDFVAILSELSLGIRCARRLSPRGFPVRFSPIVEPGRAKLPKLPMPGSVVVVEAEVEVVVEVCQGDALLNPGPLGVVLLRTNPPKDKVLTEVSRAVVSSSGSSNVKSFVSVFFRPNQ